MKNEETNGPSEPSKVVDLASFRKKKDTNSELARGRRPLYVSHMDGNVTQKDEHQFGDRLTRIRSSLDKINRLMGELKKISTDPNTNRRTEERDANDRRK